MRTAISGASTLVIAKVFVQMNLQICVEKVHFLTHRLALVRKGIVSGKIAVWVDFGRLKIVLVGKFVI